MTAKQITLTGAILSTLATGLAAIQGALPPAWALVVSSAGAGCYALLRALQKIKAGTSVKSLLSTTEAWGAALPIAAAFVTAVAGVAPKSVALGAGALAAVMLQIARSLQAAKTKTKTTTTGDTDASS